MEQEPKHSYFSWLSVHGMKIQTLISVNSLKQGVMKIKLKDSYNTLVTNL